MGFGFYGLHLGSCTSSHHTESILELLEGNEFPKELDKETAHAKLETMGISIDKWTEEQERYAKAYSEGT